MFTINKKNGLFTLLAAVSFAGFTACMDDNKRIESENTSADTTMRTGDGGIASNDVAAATDNAATSAPVKKVKKGRTSVTFSTTPSSSASVKVTMDKDGVYSYPTIMPMYPGGELALVDYVEDNITYDQSAIDADAEGTVRVAFVVDESGKVQDAQIVGNGVNSDLEREAIRVVEQMPKWTPGKVNGKNVKTRLYLPITFQIVEQ